MKTDDRRKEFEAIYANGGWDGQGSGPGSDPDFNRGFAEWLQIFVKENKVKSIFEPACGDGRWMTHLELPAMTIYSGWDICEMAVESAFRKKDLFNWFTYFSIKDCLENSWLKFDLTIIKDLFHHLDFDDRLELVQKAKERPLVLWVVDIEPDGTVCHAGQLQPYFSSLKRVFDFKLPPGYPYGPKSAFLQEKLMLQ